MNLHICRTGSVLAWGPSLDKEKQEKTDRELCRPSNESELQLDPSKPSGRDGAALGGGEQVSAQTQIFADHKE